MLKNDNLLCRKEVKIILKDFYDNREKLKHKKDLRVVKTMRPIMLFHLAVKKEY